MNKILGDKMSMVVDIKFVEIEEPLDMIPIITKDNEVLWYRAKYIGENGIRNVDIPLQERFANTFNKLKMYIDIYNFTYFVYEDAVKFFNSSKEKYYAVYGLDTELKEKIKTYTDDLNKYLSAIHNMFNEYNSLIEIKHKTLKEDI